MCDFLFSLQSTGNNEGMSRRYFGGGNGQGNLFGLNKRASSTSSSQQDLANGSADVGATFSSPPSASSSERLEIVEGNGNYDSKGHGPQETSTSSSSSSSSSSCMSSTVATMTSYCTFSILQNPSLPAGRLLVLFASCIYGSNFSIVKLLDDTMPLSVSAALRFTFAVSVVSFITLGKETEEPSDSMVVKERNLAFWGGAEIGMWYCVGYIAQGRSSNHKQDVSTLSRHVLVKI